VHGPPAVALQQHVVDRDRRRPRRAGEVDRQRSSPVRRSSPIRSPWLVAT
jgi:hypothetical protein